MKTHLSLFALLSLAGLALAQTPVPPTHPVPPHPIPPPPPPPPPPHWIAPHTRPIFIPNQTPVQVTSVEANIEILDQAAVTKLDIALTNPNPRIMESEILIPVPNGAVLKSFGFEGTNLEATAKLLPKDEARRIYDAIVAQTRDPALLEFAGDGCIKSSVFPVPANGTQKVRLVYEQLLSADGQRIDYTLPRSESVEFVVPWKINVKVKGTKPLATIYSSSHDLATKRENPNEITASTTDPRAPGSFRLSILRENAGEMTASLLAYPDPKVGGGYFLLLVAPPAPKPEAVAAIKREVTIVIDKSGSMAGTKLTQVKTAALQVLEGLNDGEGFNIIVYNEAVEMFAPQPQVKTADTMKQARQYIENLRVSGGTNIHDALVEALRQKPLEGMLPLVLFLTDGLPTIGQTTEKAIRDAAAMGNPHKRRVFSFGVGLDVNTPLLARIARESRATATYVLPTEDVEVKVGQVYKRLVGPVLSAPELKLVDGAGNPVPGRVSDVLPSSLPDVFAGDQMIVLGQYRNEEPLRFKLSGTGVGGPKEFTFDFTLDKASTANSFVARLWASNKIAVLTEAIRDQGADMPLATNSPPVINPKVKELVDEIVRLSTQFGILTEYTAFLAQEGTPLAQREAVLREAESNFYNRAQVERSGADAVSQDRNIETAKAAKAPNARNVQLDKELKTVEITNVQQTGASSLYKRGDQWREAATTKEERAPDVTVTIGTPEFAKLVDELCLDNRQGVLGLSGQRLIEHRGKRLLIR